MISAKVICDSISSSGVRLTTMELNYHRFIHSEVMTHRMFSRNASSSRAIPIEKMIKQVRENPAMPIHWGKNQSGMQAREENIVKDEYYEGYALFEYEGGVVDAPTLWKNECAYTIQNVRKLSDAGYHKQVVNRLLEPFQWIKVIVTATEWDNFFKLRLHPDAQPEIALLASKMREAMDGSIPNILEPGEWHLPLSMEGDLLTKIKTSVAGAARISYNNHDGSNRTIEKDINLHNQLLISGHMSPFEHCLTPMCNEELYNCQLASEFIGQQAYFRANFNRWTSYRWILENKDESYITVG